MIKKLIGYIGTLFVYFCLATITAQFIFVGAIWMKGGLTQDKRFQLLAILQGVDVAEIITAEDARIEAIRRQEGDLANKMVNTSQMETRHDVIMVGLGHVKTVEARLKGERQRYEMLKQRFFSYVTNLESDAVSESLQTLTQDFEVMDPVQAKSQIIRMLEDGKVDDVVWIVNALSGAKTKRLLDQFRSEEEKEHFHQIMTRLREGPKESQT